MSKVVADGLGLELDVGDGADAVGGDYSCGNVLEPPPEPPQPYTTAAAGMIVAAARRNPLGLISSYVTEPATRTQGPWPY
jgi:hypothetical protein